MAKLVYKYHMHVSNNNVYAVRTRETWPPVSVSVDLWLIVSGIGRQHGIGLTQGVLVYCMWQTSGQRILTKDLNWKL